MLKTREIPETMSEAPVLLALFSKAMVEPIVKNDAKTIIVIRRRDQLRSRPRESLDESQRDGRVLEPGRMWKEVASMVESQEAIAQSTSQTVDADPPKKPLILIVEDDLRTNSALRKIFLRKGWDTESALTVADGLAMLKLEPCGLVLDMMLPDGDGLTVLQKVRDDQLKIRVVVTTGIEDRQRIEAIKDLHPEALLQKPIDLETLLLSLME